MRDYLIAVLIAVSVGAVLFVLATLVLQVLLPVPR